MKNSIVWITLSFLGFTCSMTFAITYQIIDLKGLEGASSCTAAGINDSGQIIGMSIVSDTAYSFFWDQGTMAAYAAAEGVFDYGVTSINNNGLAVGNGGMITSEGEVLMAALFYPSTDETIILSGAGATDININGQVVLHTRGNGTIIWQEGIDNIPIPIRGYSINDSGQVAGMNDESDGYASIYDLNTQTEISLGRLTPEDLSGAATDINEQGQAVGWGIYSSTYYYAFYYDSEQGMVKIADMDPGGITPEVAINDLGQVVGTSGRKSYLWQDGELAYLDELIDPASGWSSLRALDINNSGWIVGSGMIDGQTHAFLMTPIPEPATLGLMVLGGLAAVRRRKRG